MTEMTILVAGVIGLLGAGIYGLLAVRNMFQIIIALQILVKSSVLALVMAGYASGNLALGQSLGVTVIVADTVVAVIGLALAVQTKRVLGTLDIKALATLRR